MTSKFQRGDVITLVSGGYPMTVIGIGKPWKGDKQVADENYTQVMWLDSKDEMQVRNLENILLRKT